MDGQQTHEKMFNITTYYGNASQNHNEILPHTYQNGYHKTDKKQQVLERMWRRENTHTVGGVVNWYSHYGKQCEDFSEG